jgi:hypothetical protein
MAILAHIRKLEKSISLSSILMDLLGIKLPKWHSVVSVVNAAQACFGSRLSWIQQEL